MITIEDVRKITPPRRVESQREFDALMNQMRITQSEMTEPMRQKMTGLNNRRREIGRLMAELNMELGNINREREVLGDEIKHIGSIFYGLKKELIRDNPKIFQPTA